MTDRNAQTLAALQELCDAIHPILLARRLGSTTPGSNLEGATATVDQWREAIDAYARAVAILGQPKEGQT
jgi:hypothetical protein